MTCRDYLAMKGVDLIPTSRGWKCRCPLPGHEDKDPSFYVFEDGDLQNWWCFGCSRSGTPHDIYALVMQIEGCSFTQAVSIVGVRPEDREVRRRRKSRDDTGYIQALDDSVVKIYQMGRVRSDLMSGRCTFDEADDEYRRLWEGCSNESRLDGVLR